ncbi:MAG: DUF262 domain-containing protein [bacterium]
MEINQKHWPVTTTYGIRSRIDTNPDYQRPSVWSTSQKQLLMDSILRGYDIPKFYLRKISSNPDKYEVVDGQQRLRAIWGYINGEYRLSKEIDEINGFVIEGKYYTELPDEIRSDFDVYAIDIIIISNSDEEEVREMFLRLQNGTTLKAQEKRNAMPGQMRNFVKSLVQHNFFYKTVNFANRRFTHDHVAAQMCLIELNGQICNIKDKDLNKMYEENVVFDDKSSKARKIKKVLDYLSLVFPDKTPELERYNVISLYIMISALLEKYVIYNRENEIRDWFILFEQYRRDQARLPEEDVEPELVSYHEKISHSTDASDSLEARDTYLKRKLFEKIPNIEQKDDQRIFDHQQRLAIYRRDQGLCHLKIKCDGKKCEWDNWHADHIVSWSHGGKTTVENGQVACVECNIAKGNREN